MITISSVFWIALMLPVAVLMLVVLFAVMDLVIMIVENVKDMVWRWWNLPKHG